MKKAIAMRWIKALRSGKFTQATEYLKLHYGHCCLGVLCEITKSKKWKDKEEIPYHILKKVGMKNGLGMLPLAINNHRTLADLNDHGFSFKQIATIIEKYWKEL